MAHLPLSARRGRRNLAFFNLTTSIMLVYYYVWFMFALAYRRKCWQIERRIKIRELRGEHLYQLIGESDATCISQLRMDRRTFHILCEMVRDVGGLRGTRNTSLEEIVASFLYVLSHHLKNRTVGKFFYRSPESISRNFNACLLAVLKLHHLLLKKPEPTPEDCTDDKWKYFKNHQEAKGLYGVSFPYFEQLAAIYGKDIATGENVEGFGEAVGNLEKEIAMEEEENEEEDMVSTGTARRSIDTCSVDTTSSKRQKKEPRPKRATGPSDPFADMFQDVNSQLNSVTQHVGTMATTFSGAMAREAAQEDPQQKSREKAISELSRLAFTGSEIVEAATIFAKAPEHMNMMLVLPDILRRDFVLKMLSDERKKQG